MPRAARGPDRPHLVLNSCTLKRPVQLSAVALGGLQPGEPLSVSSAKD